MIYSHIFSVYISLPYFTDALTKRRKSFNHQCRPWTSKNTEN